MPYALPIPTTHVAYEWRIKKGIKEGDCRLQRGIEDRRSKVEHSSETRNLFYTYTG
jgi:hypothetical protein